MSRSSYVVGFRPPDEEWLRMKAVWDACSAADAPVPKKVLDFFEGAEPGDAPGREIKLGKALREWSDDAREGFELDVSKLPEGVRFIRFYNSW